MGDGSLSSAVRHGQHIVELYNVETTLMEFAVRMDINRMLVC